MKYMRSSARDDFWSNRIALICEKMIPLQLSILKDEAPDTEPSHAIENFRIAAGLSNGQYNGMVFQDSDVGKWIEAASYKLTLQPDAALEREIDDIVDMIGKAQQPDGYLNTYFTLKEPGKRWTNLAECHELYCAGHLMEGAVAYYQATGKRTFLDIMCRMADHIDTVIGPENGKLRGYPGHPEVEIGLFRLYTATGNRRYLKLAKFMIDERGQKPSFFDEERAQRGNTDYFEGIHELGKEYMQAHAPVRKQMEATGHAVRAMYLYTAMAQIARETDDEGLKEACRRLWDSAVHRKMYITGGFGATAHGEAFMNDYELPNDTIYAETCASVGAVFFGQAMLQIKRDGAVADVIERILYNGMLSGMSLAADRFFYVNPLEVVQSVSGKQPGYRHALPARPKWFSCACCPPNMARLIASLPAYCYQEENDGVTIHQYLGGTVSLDKATLSLETNYPWDGDLCWTIATREGLTLRIRIPGWADETTMKLDGVPLSPAVESGYASIDLAAGTHDLRVSLSMQPKRWYAHPAVREDAGCVAFSYGPLIYCFEGVDHPEPLCALRAGHEAPVMNAFEPSLLGGVRTMTVRGVRLSSNGALYSDRPPKAIPIELRGIPYYAWANREAKDMRVWLVEQC